MVNKVIVEKVNKKTKRAPNGPKCAPNGPGYGPVYGLRGMPKGSQAAGNPGTNRDKKTRTCKTRTYK